MARKSGSYRIEEDGRRRLVKAPTDHGVPDVPEAAAAGDTGESKPRATRAGRRKTS
jgi:hypothetical protein